MTLAPHDIAGLIEQAQKKEALASDIPSPRNPSWREHLIDAAHAYELAGQPEDAARCRLAAAPAAEQKASDEAAESVGDAVSASSDTSTPRRRR